MLHNCPANTLFTLNPETHLIVSLNGKWTVETRFHDEPNTSEDHAIFQTLVSLTHKPEIYQVISYAIAADFTHLNQIAERFKGRYGAAQNLILHTEKLTGKQGVPLHTLAAILDEDEDQESANDRKPKYNPKAIMGLKTAKDLIDSYQQPDGSILVPISTELAGIAYDPDTPTAHIRFASNRKIPAIKFVRSGKLKYESALRQHYGIDSDEPYYDEDE